MQAFKNLASWPVVINAALFQITWFACALGAARGIVWPALLACTAMAVYQLQTSRRHPGDMTLVIAAIVLGLLIDSTWIQLGWISYSTPKPLVGIAPLWIIVLWVGFALTINHSLAWLKSHPLLPALAGLICAPLSYLAGVKLGALEFINSGPVALCALAMAWAAAMTLMVWLSKKAQGQIS